MNYFNASKTKKEQNCTLKKDFILMLISDMGGLKIIGELDGILLYTLSMHDFYSLLLKSGMIDGDCIIIPKNAKLVETRYGDLIDYVFKFNGHILTIALNIRTNEFENLFDKKPIFF